MDAIVGLLDNVFTWIFLLILISYFFGGDALGKIYSEFIERRKERARHRQRIEILDKRIRLAQEQSSAIALLVADRELGTDFNERLRIALEEDARQHPKLELVEDPEESAEKPQRKVKRRKS